MQVTIGSGGRRRRASRQPILAAGQRRKVKNGRIDIRTFEWQKRNWDLLDRVGVVGYGMGLTHNTLSKAQIIPAILPNNPDEDPEPSTAPDEIDLINAFRGPFGEAPDLVATAGVNFGVAGEAYVLGTPEEGYDIVSSEQLQQLSTQAVLLGPDGQVQRKLTDDDYVARIWRAHPRFREMPHAQLTAAADDCLEWLLLSRKARGHLRTRLSAGYLFIPNEINPAKMQEFVTEEGEEAEGEWEEPNGANMDADELMEELIAIMTRPLLDEDDLAGVVPWLLRGPGEAGQHIRQEAWRRSDEEQADSERRMELIKTIGGALDWPVEKVLGMGDSSYWNAWQIDASSFEEHFEPGLRGILRSLTIAWYRPMLEEMGMSPEEARKRIMWRDLSAFQPEPDFDQAAVAHERLVISDEALRRYGRFDEDRDAPDEAELERRKPVIIEAPVEEESTPEGGAEPGSDEAEDVAASLVAASTQERDAERLAGRLASIDHGLLTRITSAADRELNRALTQAGARIRSKVVNKEEASILKDTPNELVGRHLGALYVRQTLQLEDGDLIPPGTFRQLERDLERWIRQAQDAAADEVESFTGQVLRNESDEEEGASTAVALIIGILVALALGRLFTSRPSPDEGEIAETSIPPNEIMEALSVAGGAGMVAPIGNTFDQGIGNGQRVREWMEAAGFFTEGYRWSYGDPSARDANFEPHRRLDGTEFVSWEESALANIGGWPGVSHYYPQDHGGCLCSYERIFLVETID